MQIETPDLKSRTSTTPRTPPWLHLVIWLWACLLLAILQISWGGYQLGVGNQGIQIAFLQKLHDGELFRNDAMVSQTLRSYPSFFFHILARLLSFTSLPTLYLTLHVAATAGVFAAIIALATAMTRSRWAGLVCAFFLLAGHHQALAGEGLYSAGFTHTWAIFPLSLLSLYLFFRDRHVPAFLLAGLIFNFHALEAAHLFAIMGLASLFEIRAIGLQRLATAVGAFVVAAIPTVIIMLSQRQGAAFHDPLWMQLMYIRSADHSFPFMWWNSSTPEVERFVCIIALAALSLGFLLPRRMRRKALLLAAGIGLLFIGGVVFTEWIPLPVVIRAQLFRSSRLLYILSLILIAHGCVKGLQMPWRKYAGIALPMAWLEFVGAILTICCLSFPGMITLLPWLVLFMTIVALVHGRLTWYDALISGIAIMVCILASQTIGFTIPGIASGHGGFFEKIIFSAFFQNKWPFVANVLLSLSAFVLFLAVIAFAFLATRKLRPAFMGVVAGGGFLVTVFAMAAFIPVIWRSSVPDHHWMEAQLWVRNHSKKDAVILTPPSESGFRIYSQRAIAGEYRDGTQLYFKADFAKTWWDAMNAYQPNKVVRADKKDLENRGTPLQLLEDEKIVRLAMDVAKATYIVLPKVMRDGEKVNIHAMKVAHENADWVVYEPRFMDFTGSPGDASLVEEDKIIVTKALPVIENSRKSTARFQVVDAAGKPVTGVDFRVAQVSSAFGFGCSLPFFQVPDVDTKADYKPPAVTPGELTRFLEVFNYSVIPFSGQWRFMEPQQGKINYADLDAYVQWCTEHNVRPEFRFLAGYQPAWMKGKIARDQADIIIARAKDLSQRYAGKIIDWQLTSEDVGLKEIGLLEYNEQTRKDRVTAFFTKLREVLPNGRIGICDDTRFFTPKTGPDAKADMLRGLDTLRALQKLGIKIDYFAIAGKRPLGVWAGGKSTYETLDEYAKAGVKIRITELGVAVGDRIEGTVREGTWTPQLQAEYYERFFTLCYGHPAVEAVNVMGIGDATWRPGMGMLDASGNPTPAFKKLKEMVTDRWRTRISSEKLPAGGNFQFRGFQGTYELALNLPDGKKATTTFLVAPPAAGTDPATANSFRFVLSADGTLKPQNP